MSHAPRSIAAQGYMFMEYDCDWAHGDYEQKWYPRWKSYKASDTATSIFVKEMALEFEVPHDFNPLPQQVAALEAEKAEALAAYQKTVAEVNERLSKLQALTFDEVLG